MSGKLKNPENIALKLRQVEALKDQGKALADAVRQIAVTVQMWALSESPNLPDVDRRLSYAAMPNQVSFRYFKTSPEIIQLAVMLYVRFPLSLRNVEDLLHERGVDVSYESVRYWWHRLGSQFARQIKKRRAVEM